MSEKYTAVLFSGGLDSAVLIVDEIRQSRVQPVYVSVGFAWEDEERAMAARFLSSPLIASHVMPIVHLQFDMRDVFTSAHWAVRGEPPAFDTPDEDVFIDGRNVILLSKTGVYAAREAPPGRTVTLSLGTLAGNPFPDATPVFFDTFSRALSLGLATPIAIA